MTKPKQVWMVRAGNNNELIDLVESKEAVAIGWNAMGDVSGLKTRAEFKEKYQEIYPEDSFYRAAVNTGQIYRFAKEIKEEDYILTFDKGSREILIGLAKGEYEYNPVIFGEVGEDHPADGSVIRCPFE